MWNLLRDEIAVLSYRDRVIVSASLEADIVVRLRAAGCVFAEDEAALLVSAATGADQLESMVLRRIEGIPLEHVLGWVEFRGLRIAVDPGVFVPRQRTAFLVEQASRLAEPGAVVLDLCCGSGALGVALAAAVQNVELFASDIDPAAVVSARRNIPTGQVFEGDLFDPLPASLRGRVDILLANTPYVPTDAIGMMPPEARLHEALVALDGGTDGLDIQRRVAADAQLWLAPGGYLLVESNERQAPLSVTIFENCGLEAWIVSSDELEATVVIGRRPLLSTPSR